jgi:hypothetical protein
MAGPLLATATTTKTAEVATFNIGGTLVSVQVARDLTIAVGDVCLIVRVGSQWLATARLYPAAPAAVDLPPAPVPKPSTITGRLLVPPVETRSYRPAGWRTDVDDLYQGQYSSEGNHTGCAFYGTKPRSLVGATVTSATARIRRRAAGGQSAARDVTLWLVTEATRPAGAPTLTSTTAGPSLRWGDSVSYTIPTAWAQAMVDGTAGGLAVFESDGDPYMILDGRGRYSASFTLTINWTR